MLKLRAMEKPHVLRKLTPFNLEMMLLCISCIPLLPCTKPSNRSPIVDQIPDKPSSVPTPTVELVTDEPVQGVTLANIDNLLLLPNQLAWPKSQVLHGPFRCRCYNEKREGKSLRFFSLTKPEATLSNWGGTNTYPRGVCSVLVPEVGCRMEILGSMLYASLTRWVLLSKMMSLDMREFSKSLTNWAYTWYVNLKSGSVHHREHLVSLSK